MQKAEKWMSLPELSTVGAVRASLCSLHWCSAAVFMLSWTGPPLLQLLLLAAACSASADAYRTLWCECKLFVCLLWCLYLALKTSDDLKSSSLACLFLPSAQAAFHSKYCYYFGRTALQCVHILRLFRIAIFIPCLFFFFHPGKNVYLLRYVLQARMEAGVYWLLSAGWATGRALPGFSPPSRMWFMGTWAAPTVFFFFNWFILGLPWLLSNLWADYHFPNSGDDWWRVSRDQEPFFEDA